MMAVLTTIGWVLLWILIGILGLLLLIVLLLCVPVYLRAQYDAQTRLWVRYGLISIPILPAKPKKTNKKKKKPEKEKKQEKPPKKPLKETLAEYGIPDHLPETMAELLKMLTHTGRMLNGLRRSLYVSRLHVELVCGGADAAQAAINYGRAWPILVGIEQALRVVVRMRTFNGTPVLDYAAERQTLRGEAVLRVLPIRLAVIVIYRGLRVYGGYRTIKRKRKDDNHE